MNRMCPRKVLVRTQRAQYPLTNKEDILNDIGIPNMIKGVFLNQGLLGFLGSPGM